MSAILLDTHLVLWARLAPDKLSASEKGAIVEAARRCISVASLWEIAILMRLRRVPQDAALVGDVPPGFETLDIAQRHALDLVTLPMLHRDPFDRMLVAQARCEELALLTRDKRIAEYGVAGVKILDLS